MTDKLRAQFITYDKAHPEIYIAFASMARGFILNREKRGAKAIIELVRSSIPLPYPTWAPINNSNLPKSRLKIDNRYTAYYGRKFEKDYPQHKGYFEFRQV